MLLTSDLPMQVTCLPGLAIEYLTAWQIALVLVDEVHLLNESRGSALEAGVVGRIKRVSQKQEMQEVCSNYQKMQTHTDDKRSPLCMTPDYHIFHWLADRRVQED